MKINELRPAKGSFHARKRVGRGIGSGHGKTSGRGMKGQKARSGGQIHPRFEGGQMPLVRRVPKRGFHNPCAEKWEIVNVGVLNRFEDGTEVTLEKLWELSLVGSRRVKVKILAKGDLSKSLTVRAHAFSAKAREMIEARGGKVEVL